MSITIHITEARLNHLKVKIKHLALEPKIIRHEEKKALKRMRWANRNKNDKTLSSLCYSNYHNLRSHRVLNVRNESRSAYLAYAFLRNKSIRSLNEKMIPNWIINRAAALVNGFGDVIFEGNSYPDKRTKEGRIQLIDCKIREWANIDTSNVVQY